MELQSTILWVIAIGYPIGTYLAQKYFESRLTHHFNQKIADYNNELLIKQKSELIAELLVEWVDNPVNKKKLNQLSFEAFLWLPSDIAVDLSDTLSHKEGAKDIRQILFDVREHLLGKEEKMNHNQIITWQYPR